MPDEKPNPQGLGSALNKLLSDPDLMERIRETAGLTPAKDAPPEARTEGERSDDAPPPDALASLLSDPALLSRLPQLLSLLPSGGDDESPVRHDRQRSPEECRNDLLRALQPFLSPEKRNAVETILRISRLGAVIRQMR